MREISAPLIEAPGTRHASQSSPATCVILKLHSRVGRLRARRRGAPAPPAVCLLGPQAQMKRSPAVLNQNAPLSTPTGRLLYMPCTAGREGSFDGFRVRGMGGGFPEHAGVEPGRRGEGDKRRAAGQWTRMPPWGCLRAILGLC